MLSTRLALPGKRVKLPWEANHKLQLNESATCITGTARLHIVRMEVCVKGNIDICFRPSEDREM